MFPYFKLVKVLVKAKFRSRVTLDDRTEIQLRAGITDIDIFGELNNARHLVIMELSRWDFSQRVGLLGYVRKKKWGLVVGGASIRYRRRIPLWSRYSTSCQVVCHDGRWFYCLQETHMNGEICSSGLIKVGLVSKNGLEPAVQVVADMGYSDWGNEMPQWVSAWIQAEGLRPWPSS